MIQLEHMWNVLCPFIFFLDRFERFLSGLSRDLRRRTTEHERLEDAVRSRTALQEEQLNRLYEEMENQVCR